MPHKAATNDIDRHILFVGPGMNGGISAVLNVYRTMFSPFKFVKTQTDGGKVRKGLAAIAGYALALLRLTFDRDIRIVHIHSASNASFWRKSLIIRMAKATGRKVILHNHGGGFRTFYKSAPEKIKAVLDKCDVVIGLSAQWVQFFKEIGCREVLAVNNVIDTPEIRPSNDSDGKFHIVFLGKIFDQKGIYDLLDALRTNRERFAGRLTLHVGGNGEVDKFRSLIADPALADMVTYEGWVDGEKKAVLFNRMDALILPSYVEGVPICLLEAMSYGKPVITTPVGGIPSIVTDGHNGLFIAPGDKGAIASAITRLMDSPELASAMGRNGTEIAKDYLAPEVAKKLRSLYAKLLTD